MHPEPNPPRGQSNPTITEITDPAGLEAALATGTPLAGVRVQGVDLRQAQDALLARDDLAGLVILGGIVPPRLAAHLQAHGALLFPAVPDAPVDPYRGHLYTAHELYAGLDDGLDATTDGRAYTFGLATGGDIYATTLTALHDDAMRDALTEALSERRAVGVMGGHALVRGTEEYARAARLGATLAETGHLVLTGGGPGAMEAANLGAYIAARAGAAWAEPLREAMTALAEVPSYAPDGAAWARAGLAVRARLDAALPGTPELLSVGVPTWFYGHEPSNVFGQGIAKFFSNALREDELLARSTDGLVVLPGAAGTTQEIFQAVTPRFYGTTAAPLVLVGRAHWEETVPVLGPLTALGGGSRWPLHLVDEPGEVPALLTSGAGRAS